MGQDRPNSPKTDLSYFSNLKPKFNIDQNKTKFNIFT